jgi:hypothetical protein
MAVLLRDALPSVGAISAWSERLVGGALIAVGLWALRRSVVRPSTHAHGAVSHAHLHVQSGPRWMRRLGHAHASFLLGALHGIAGSSHFFGILPALALPTRGASLLYVAAFGVGTVSAMTAFAAVAGLAGRRMTPGAWPQRALMFSAAIIAIIVGGIWLIAPAGSPTSS